MLTIDENIQFMAERALDHAMEKTQALNGTVVVQDVHTGQILALAIRPTFNPNQFRHTTPALLRDHAVSDVYEPGSTFKLVTYSAALDAEGRQARRSRSTARAARSPSSAAPSTTIKANTMGVVTVHKALEESSDVAAVKLAMKIGPDKFYQYIRDFGFGQRTGIELPGETRGLLRPVKRWQPSSIGYVAIGQEEAVTPIQLVCDGFDHRKWRRLSAAARAHAGSIESHKSQPKTPPHRRWRSARPNEELPNPLPAGAIA